MSTMKADLIQNRLGTNSPLVTKGDFVRAFAISHTGQAAPTYTFNIAGIVDQGIGYWQHNYTALLANGMNPSPASVANLPMVASTYSTALSAFPQIIQSNTATRTDEWINFATVGAMA